MKLRNKFLLTFVSIALLSIAITALTAVVTMREEVQAEIYGSLYLTAFIEAEDVEDHIEMLASKTIILAADTTLLESLENNELQIDSDIKDISVVDLQKNILASSNEEFNLSDESEIYNEALDLGNGETIVFYGKDYLSLATKILEDEIPTGVLIVNFSATAIDQSLSCAIAETPHCPQVRWNNLDIQLLNTETRPVTVSSAGGLAKLNPALSQSCDRKTETTNYINENGVPMIGSSICTNAGWTILVEVPEEKAFAALNTLESKILITSCLILLIVVLSLYFPLNWFVAPLEELTKAIKEIRHRTKPHILKRDSSDEIAELFHSFNEMQNNMLMYKTAVEEAFDQIVISNPDGLILYANPATELATGYKLKEVIGQKPSIWGGLMNQDFYEEMWKTIRDKKETFHGEFTNKRKNRKKFTSQAYITPILDQRGKIQYYLSIQRDITKHKKIEEARAEFTSLASHQLNTPLAGILWSSNELLSQMKKKATKSEEKYLVMIQELTLHMQGVIKMLLNIAKVEIGERKIKKEDVALPVLLRKLIKAMAISRNKKKLNIKISGIKKIPATISTDPQILSEALTNILSNAIKYSSKDAPIQIKLGTEGKKIFIAVIDKGQGIPEDEIDTLFERFARGDTSEKNTVPGSGLGLYFTQKILKLIKGKVTVISKVGKGSTFTIWIPNK